MPENPESEGSRLITLKEIEQEHGVSRSALHTYRRSASFPQPVTVEGSTRVQYRADEVAAWFEANPPQQGRRTDLAPQDEGAAMPQMEQPSRVTTQKPDHLTQDQWTAIVYSLHEGLGEGLRKAGLRSDWAIGLGAQAIAAIRSKLDELVAQERAGGR